MTNAVGVPLTLDDPGKVWLIQLPVGVHQSLPICPPGVWKNTFINEKELAMAVGALLTLVGPGSISLIQPPVRAHLSLAICPLLVL